MIFNLSDKKERLTELTELKAEIRRGHDPGDATVAAANQDIVIAYYRLDRSK